ncbi:MAG: nitroreductase [Nocardioides sp.]|uniref:nitroreductase n=1 Tax=Nocardioides sp. TaxID=35761 RepID=UPI0039E29704
MTPDEVIETVLAERFSCRAFLPGTVPAATQRRMFALAQRTASWCNSQAWQVHVAPSTEAFSEALLARVLAGPEAPDLAGPASYEGVYRDRRRASGFGLYGALGIARDDADGRLRQMLENFRFFGAPHVAVISTPRALGVYGAVDCGAYVSTLLTAAQSLGVATIAQAAVAMYADVVHEHLGVPADRDVVCAVSYGYPDLDHPANAFRTERASIDEAVSGLA